jgi:hypothetical protein
LTILFPSSQGISGKECKKGQETGIREWALHVQLSWAEPQLRILIMISPPVYWELPALNTSENKKILAFFWLYTQDLLHLFQYVICTEGIKPIYHLFEEKSHLGKSIFLHLTVTWALPILEQKSNYGSKRILKRLFFSLYPKITEKKGILCFFSPYVGQKTCVSFHMSMAIKKWLHMSLWENVFRLSSLIYGWNNIVSY